MHFYLNPLEFAALYTKPFKDYVNPSASKQKEFGVPHHRVVSLAELIYIYMSLTSVAVEVEESQFHDVR